MQSKFTQENSNIKPNLNKKGLIFLPIHSYIILQTWDCAQSNFSMMQYKFFRNKSARVYKTSQLSLIRGAKGSILLKSVPLLRIFQLKEEPVIIHFHETRGMKSQHQQNNAHQQRGA